MFKLKTSNELLPEWLDLFLDDLETTLCFPIIIIIVLCTAQFIVNQVVDVGSVFYKTLKPEPGEEGAEGRENGGTGIMEKLKGLLKGLGIGGGCDDNTCKEERANFPPSGRTNFQEDWDGDDEDDY